MALPPTVGYMVQVVKGTSLAALIGFTELAKAGAQINTITFEPVLVFGTVAGIYFADLLAPVAAQRLSGKAAEGRSREHPGHVIRRGTACWPEKPARDV